MHFHKITSTIVMPAVRMPAPKKYRIIIVNPSMLASLSGRLS
jgi:hypothetical protein